MHQVREEIGNLAVQKSKSIERIERKENNREQGVLK